MSDVFKSHVLFCDHEESYSFATNINLGGTGIGCVGDEACPTTRFPDNNLEAPLRLTLNLQHLPHRDLETDALLSAYRERATTSGANKSMEGHC